MKLLLLLLLLLLPLLLLLLLLLLLPLLLLPVLALLGCCFVCSPWPANRDGSVVVVTGEGLSNKGEKRKKKKSTSSEIGCQIRLVGERKQLVQLRTWLTDAMTCRYSQVDVQNSEQMRLQPDHGTEDTTAMSPTERNFCDCSSTCNYCSSICCLRKRGHTVHLCLIHKIP